MKERLVRELASARSRLEQAGGVMRERTRISTLVKREIPRTFVGALHRHPLSVALGASAAGFLLARAIGRRRRRRAPEYSTKSTAAKALLLVLTKSLLKPVLKDAVLRGIRQGLKKSSGSSH